jgi:hypothetical protein
MAAKAASSGTEGDVWFVNWSYSILTPAFGVNTKLFVVLTRFGVINAKFFFICEFGGLSEIRIQVVKRHF